MKKLSGLLALFVFFFDTLAFAEQRPLVVLVHGANFSKNSWSLVQKDLSNMGIETDAPDLYNAQEKVNLADVSSRLCTEIRKVNRPVTLVGHSQGGAIITVAANECGNLIGAMIYVAAVYPLPGTGVFDLLSDVDNQYYNTCGYLDEKANTYNLKDLESCKKVFMQDATQVQAERFFKTMVNEPASIGNSKVDYTPEKLVSIPKYYIQTRDDLIISKATQDKIIATSDIKKTYLIESSHSPFIKQHLGLSQFIIEILGNE